MRRWLLFGIPLYGLGIFLATFFGGVVFLGAVKKLSSMESSTIGAMLLLAIASTAILIYGFHSTNREIHAEQRARNTR